MTYQNETFPPPLGEWEHIDIAMVRPRKGFAFPVKVQGPRVQLGAGYKIIEGWFNLEYPDWRGDCQIPACYYPIQADGVRRHISHSARQGPGTYAICEDNSVAEIASYHTLDHLTPEDVVFTLGEINRVLKPGGIFTNIVPHYSSQLANECLMHKSRFAIDTFRNIFSERQYKNTTDGKAIDWHLQVRTNFLYGITERNLVLVTQLQKVV